MNLCANDGILSLITLVHDGDDDAFSKLVSLYAPMLNKVISGFTNPSIRYDEAFSEACVALHRAAISYDVTRSDGITFGLYARICVYRRISDLAEKYAREIHPVDLNVELISTDSGIEQRLVGRERMARYLKIAHRVLSAYEYSVFLLYIDGYSTAEISQKLDRDIKSIENAKTRMIKRLREECDLFSDI